MSEIREAAEEAAQNTESFRLAVGNLIGLSGRVEIGAGNYFTFSRCAKYLDLSTAALATERPCRWCGLGMR